VAAGLVLIGIAILAWLSMLKEKRTWRHYIGIISNFLIGIGVALLAVMLVSDASSDLGSSPWTLPLLVFVMFTGQSPSALFILRNTRLIKSDSSPTQPRTPHLAQSRRYSSQTANGVMGLAFG
jgi:hypothetical protein